MFENSVPGQDAHLMQGLAIDGRQVSRVELSGMIKYEDVKKGLSEWDQPFFALTFYDAQRREIGRDFFGPYDGTRHGWKKLKKRIRVPVATREAMIRIGMFGATGKCWFDELSLKKVD
jgi:protein-L-isoaspartate(D-aspartate) O-methyltransferase